MANKLYAEASISDIADAIREKNGTQMQYKVAQMGDAVRAITTGIEPEKYEWQQTPNAVQNYLDNVDYSGIAYDTSDVQEYATASILPALAVGKAVAVDAGTLDVGGYRKTVSAGTQTIYNCVPGAKTPYSLNSSGVVKQAGTLKPTKRLRQIRCATTNCRDLGGWACDGGYIKYGILYRSGELNSADADIFLNQLGLKIELDLTADGSPSAIPGLRYVYPGQAVYYSLAQTDAWKTNLRAVFDAAKYNEPLIFHCSMGADRTGTLACIIEGLLGVSQSDLDKDYELTSFAATSFLRRRDGNYQGGTADWKHLISAIQALSGSTFRDKCVNFVASLGFTAAEINAFRSAMIDGTPETVTPAISTYTITKTLTHATATGAATVDQYQDYESDITPDEGYVIDSVEVKVGGNTVTPTPFDGVQVPDGIVEITQNGIADVSWKGYANVNVPSVTPTGTINITTNGNHDVTQYAAASVNVPGVVSGSVTLSQSASFTVNTGLPTATHFILSLRGEPVLNRAYFAYCRDASNGFALYKTSSTSFLTCYDTEYSTSTITISIANGIVSFSNTSFAFAAGTYDWFAW